MVVHPRPGCRRALRGGSLLLCVGLLSVAVAQERAGSVLDQVKDALPAYDPAFGEKQKRQQEEAKAEAAGARETRPTGQAPRPRLQSIPPLVRKSNQTILAGEEPAAAPEPAPMTDVVELPEVTVETKRLPQIELPRLPVDRPQQDVEMEPFLTPAARAEKLKEKHLSAVDRRVLNRFELFGSNAQRALSAERREQYARAMNDLAVAIEMASVWGVSEEEKEKLRKEYFQLLVNRPQ